MGRLARELCRSAGPVHAERMRSCFTTASTVRRSVDVSRQRTKLHSRAAAKHCTVELRHLERAASHPPSCLLLESCQLARIDAIERVLEPVAIDTDDQGTHQHIEEDSQLDNEWHAIGRCGRAEEQTVLHH
jgi:hypothetical protein